MKLYNCRRGTNQYMKKDIFLDARVGTWKSAYWIAITGIIIISLGMLVKAGYDQEMQYRNFELISPLSLVRDIAYAEEKPVLPPLEPTTIKDKLMVASIETFTTDEALDIEHLVNGESGFNPTIVNKSSGACGLFQALPCAKMPCNLSRSAEDVDCQIRWGLGYIKARYGTPNNAWAFWMKQSPHWY